MTATEDFFTANSKDLIKLINDGLNTLTKGTIKGVAVADLDAYKIIVNTNNDLYIKTDFIQLKTIGRVIMSPCWVIMKVSSKTYPATREQPEEVHFDELEIERSIHPLTTANNYIKTLFSMCSDQLFDSMAMAMGEIEDPN
jgi:hypothetical protein